MDKEIYLYLEDIKGYVNSVLTHLNGNNNNMDIDEIKMYLSSIVEIIDNVNEYLYKNNKLFIDKDELINYLYYLEDKVDKVYKIEVTKSINRYINKIMEVNEYEQL